MELNVDAARLAQEFETLASFSATPTPSITRVVFTEPDLAARSWLKQLCAEASLHLREDAVGNLFARWPGTEPDLPAIGTGSHIDAIPNSGRFDGTVGVLGGLEAIRALQRSNYTPRRSIELLLFTSEEPTRFGIGCLGSRLLSGALPPTKAAALRDSQGCSLDRVRSSAGFTGSLDTVRLPQNYYCKFVELHIEQGPLLEQSDIPIGIVKAIAAPASMRVLLEGEGGHAGAVLMPQRRDAFLGAAEIALAVESAAGSTGAMDTVATAGVCNIFPGLVNGIPSRATLELDIRDTDLLRRDAVLRQIQEASRAIATKRRLQLTLELLNADAPAQCDSAIVNTIKRSCAAEGIRYTELVSRAYHDSLFISRIAPAGMIFIPCRNGVSHRPDEFADTGHIVNGVKVLARTLAELAS